MKKITKLLAVTLMLCTSVSFAGISIQYSTSAAVKLWNGAALVNLPSSSLVQLVWSADSSIATPIESSIPTTGGQYADGDYVLFSKPTTVAGGFTDVQMDGIASYQDINVGSQNIVNGYVYVLVFGSGAPAAGTYYGVSSLVFPLSNVDAGAPLGSPNVLNVSPSPGLVIGPVGQGGQGFQVQAVPEPSSLALLGIGLGLVAFRRRFSRK
jgi:hypothetical protein